MLKTMFPGFFKRKLRKYIAREVREYNASKEAPPSLEKSYLPSHQGEKEYFFRIDQGETRLLDDGLPVPPQDLWIGYADTPANYLAGGKTDVTSMAKVLREGGFEIAKAGRVLEFGCAAGRLIRHVRPLAPQAELWGVDISAQHIRWCVNHLTPAMHFATTTTIPHLPFEDRSFDLIFCGSVFTHIEDVQETWLLEMSRILRPGGRLYATIHDEYTIELLSGKYRDSLLAQAMNKQPIYVDHKDDFDMIVFERGAASQVFYQSSYFRRLLPPSLQWVSQTPEAYGYQTAIVLERR